MLKLGSKPSEMIMTKITVSDLQRSYEFYTQAVGLKPTDPQTADQLLASDADFVELSLNQSGTRRDACLTLIRRKGDVPSQAAAAMTWVAFKVPDVAAAIARLKAAGAPIRSEATPYDGAVFGIAYDPDGYTVEFLQAEPVA